MLVHLIGARTSEEGDQRAQVAGAVMDRRRGQQEHPGPPRQVSQCRITPRGGVPGMMRLVQDDERGPRGCGGSPPAQRFIRRERRGHAGAT